MKYCKECGSEISAAANFCKQCGTPVDGKSGQPTLPAKVTGATAPTRTGSTGPNGSTNSTTIQPGPPRKPMPRKTKIILISGLAVLLLLFGAHKIAESMLSKERLIERFETALLEKDADALAELLTSNDKKLRISKKTVKGFLDYFEENPAEEQGLIANLRAQAKFYDEKSAKENSIPLVDLYDDIFSYSPVTLKEDSKLFTIPKYRLNIESVYLTVKTNYKDTVLYFDDEEIGTADEANYESTFGPFVPGFHTLKGTLKTDFVDLEAEKEIFLDGYDKNPSTSLNIEAEDITVYLPYSENLTGTAKLFINGKDVEVNVLENRTFGPVTTDGSMDIQVEVKMPWGKVKTEKVAIDDYYVELSYKLDDIRTPIMNTVHKFVDEYIQAHTKIDTSGLTTAGDELKKDIEDRVSDLTVDEIIVKAEYISTDFNLDSFRLGYDEKWYVKVSTRSKLKEGTSYAGEEEKEMEETTWEQNYYLAYDEKAKTWIVQGFENNWQIFNDDNIKTLTKK